MREFFETLKQVALGLFVNGSYDIMQGNITATNAYIVTLTVASMYLLNIITKKLDRRTKWKDKQ